MKNRSSILAAYFKRLLHDESGASTLEWTLIVGTIILPFYAMIHFSLDILVAYYQVSMDLVGLPFP
ncbi:Flp family type IVb pilin [Poriferisphaera sp. WC338]|uniref:Flp family type IVb pilin n=1 Tax=Poriferisphaera sp. WC338 TaxID=3425129 RepID=UPI003D813A72